MLLVESGIAYSLVWVTYLFICPIPRLVVNLRIYQAVVLSSQGSGYTPFSYGIQYFTEGCLLALVVSVSFCPHLALPARPRCSHADEDKRRGDHRLFSNVNHDDRRACTKRSDKQSALSSMLTCCRLYLSSITSSRSFKNISHPPQGRTISCQR